MNGNTMKTTSCSDWTRFDALTDEEIDTCDIPPLDEEFFARATLRLPHPQATITLHLDADVLEWFETQGKAYQQRMNAILRWYMENRRQQVGGMKT